jgi:phosphoglycerate dehydrogenase-like enzyme
MASFPETSLAHLSPRKLRVVVNSPDAEKFADQVRASGRDFEIRCRPSLETGSVDLEWANTLVTAQPVGGRELEGIDWVHSTNAGVDDLLFERDWPQDTLLTRTVGNFASRIGEFCLCRALLLSQGVLTLKEQQRSRQWRKLDIAPINQTRVVVVGTGEIGAGIGRSFSGLGCDVIGVSRSGAQREPFSEVLPIGKIDQALGLAGMVVLALPLTEATENLFDVALLRECKGASLINVGRGRTLVESALLEALDGGWISHASLDVFQTEPLPPESPLWTRNDVLISPHLAAKTLPEDVAASFLEVLHQLEKGSRPRLAVDPELGY